MKYGALMLAILFSMASCQSSTQQNEETPAPSVESSDTSNESLVVDRSVDASLPSPLDKIALPKGFKISVFAEVPGARSMTMSDNGVLYVGSMGEKVYAVTDDNNDGKADQIYTIANKLNMPNGVAWKDGDLYIAAVSTLYKIENIDQKLQSPPSPMVLRKDYPTDKHHGWKYIAFGPDGKLYIPVGAPCNICESKDSIYASITRVDKDGSNREIFAKGIRNTVGFTWHPTTGDMWFTDNGRDMLGDDTPRDELNIASTSGNHYGYPYCHEGRIKDPEFGDKFPCDQFVAPALNLTPHGASLGLKFYTGDKFPAPYKNRLFIAEHGSWNRSEPIGYRVMMTQLNADGKPEGYEVFADGWLQPNGKVLGRPVDILVLKDGSMLVSDDYAGLIYKITYQE